MKVAPIHSKIGTNLGDSARPHYRPDGRVGPGHLTGLTHPVQRLHPSRRAQARAPEDEVGDIFTPSQEEVSAPHGEEPAVGRRRGASNHEVTAETAMIRA